MNLSSPARSPIAKLIVLSMSIVSLVISIIMFFVPLYNFRGTNLMPLGVLSSDSTNPIMNLVAFIIVFVLALLGLILFIRAMHCYGTSEVMFVDKVRKMITTNTLASGAYFLVGVIYCATGNARGGDYSTAAYIPLLLSVLLTIAFSFVSRRYAPPTQSEQEKSSTALRIEFFVYGMLITVVTVLSALTDIIKVKFINPRILDTFKVNGWAIFKSYNHVEPGFELVGFFLLVILTIMSGLFIASLVSMISRSKLFYKITLAEVVCGAVSSLILGLFGKYYEVVQRMDEEAVVKWINRFIGIEGLVNFDVEYKVTSQSFYWFIVVLVLVLIVLIRKPYTKGTVSEALISVDAPLQGPKGADTPAPEEEEVRKEEESYKEPTVGQVADVDPCPAFSEIDAKYNLMRSNIERARMAAFESPSLPELVQFVVNYARDSRLHLSYTAEDIAAFIAGLGATRLTILQGMSGTGKTSLPKIFTEAILGNCELVEVESSWRDKNELLGYYNEFSRTYTPKKFTQALYRAKLNPSQITFIVLDEMNLSRIEYYFSDFLSLMENEEDKREIKLLNVGLYRTVDGNKYAYRGLTDGHTLKIPSNVWFIGTANRDESTFEISDKVYDRAHTMNFNKRAPKVTYRSDPIPQRYLSVGELLRLLEEAKNNVQFDLDTCAVVKEVEALLAPYNISFGNRVALQIENFVKIYTACFSSSETVIDDALERILLSKVVSKLEFKSIENKESLAAAFRRLKLQRCSDFILKLNED